MALSPGKILVHFPDAPKRLPLYLFKLLIRSYRVTLTYLATFAYYPSFDILLALRRIQVTKFLAFNDMNRWTMATAIRSPVWCDEKSCLVEQLGNRQHMNLCFQPLALWVDTTKYEVSVSWECDTKDLLYKWYDHHPLSYPIWGGDVKMLQYNTFLLSPPHFSKILENWGGGGNWGRKKK